jgi:hypothetical protein
MNFTKTAVKIMAYAICTAILVTAAYLMIEKSREAETDWQYMKIFVESTVLETKGQCQTYNDKYLQLMKVRYTGKYVFIITEDGYRYPYPNDRYNVWYVVKKEY